MTRRSGFKWCGNQYYPVWSQMEFDYLLMVSSTFSVFVLLLWFCDWLFGIVFGVFCTPVADFFHLSWIAAVQPLVTHMFCLQYPEISSAYAAVSLINNLFRDRQVHLICVWSRATIQRWRASFLLSSWMPSFLVLYYGTFPRCQFIVPSPLSPKSRPTKGHVWFVSEE